MVARQLHLTLPLQREAIETAQFSLLRRALAHAKANSPFYRKHLDHINTRDIRCRTKLAGLPFLLPEHLTAAAMPLQCLSQSRVARIITLSTSGSTGRPKRIAFDRTDLQSTGDFFRAGMKNLLNKKDAVLILLPADTPDSTGHLLYNSLQQNGNFAHTLWPPQAEKAAQLVITHKVRTIVGLPQHLLALSCHFARMPQAVAGIRNMLLCSDYAPRALRQRIEENCGCTTFLHYGTTESGLGGGVECAAHCGCHLREADLLIEIIDPETGAPLPDGESGEVVLTTLSRRCMPLFRYRTGDRAALMRSPCPCGAAAARLVSIQGRQLQYTLADGTILTSQMLDDHLFAEPALIDYRASLEQRQGREQLDIDYLTDGSPLPAEKLRQLLPRALPPGRTTRQHSDFFYYDHTIKRTITDNRRTTGKNIGCSNTTGKPDNIVTQPQQNHTPQAFAG